MLDQVLAEGLLRKFEVAAKTRNKPKANGSQLKLLKQFVKNRWPLVAAQAQSGQIVIGLPTHADKSKFSLPPLPKIIDKSNVIYVDLINSEKVTNPDEKRRTLKDIFYAVALLSIDKKRSEILVRLDGADKKDIELYSEMGFHICHVVKGKNPMIFMIADASDVLRATFPERLGLSPFHAKHTL
jgi:hypothetical protein